jgi:hypothetical protein
MLREELRLSHLGLHLGLFGPYFFRDLIEILVVIRHFIKHKKIDDLSPSHMEYRPGNFGGTSGTERYVPK